MHTSTMPAVEPTTDRPDGWARRRARIAGEIERAALELFAADGPDVVTVEQIAQRAGVSVRTFFRYFRTRDEIMVALPHRQVDDLCARVVARPAAESVLEAFIAAVGEAQEAPDDLWRLWGRAMRQWDIAQPEPQPGTGMVGAYGEAIAARMNVPSDDTRVAVMATAIASVMWLAFLRWLGSDGERSLVEVVADCFKVLAQLAGPATSPRPPDQMLSTVSPA